MHCDIKKIFHPIKFLFYKWRKIIEKLSKNAKVQKNNELVKKILLQRYSCNNSVKRIKYSYNLGGINLSYGRWDIIQYPCKKIHI